MPDRTAWMRGRYGVMCHWLFPGVLPEKGESAPNLDEAVNRFDVGRFLADFEATGGNWLVFTFGQNSGYYASPNPEIDKLAGIGHCSQRDLALEIAEGVHRLSKRFIAYLPCEIGGNRSLHEGFAWNTEEGTDQAEFQRRYVRMVEEWAVRFGKRIDGWWFDGCYTWPVFHNGHMAWPSWYDAARAGNPDAILTFNDGCFCVGSTRPIVADHDYLSGEADMLVKGRIRLGRTSGPAQTHLPESRFVPDTRCQWHCLVPIDCMWMHGNPPPDWLPDSPYRAIDPTLTHGPMEPPLYSDDDLYSFLSDCLNVGGAVTLNVGIYQEGHLGQETVRQLARLRNRL